jgi:8-oxo-dGTP pyrophosphatase MutT (NUDIX family)
MPRRAALEALLRAHAPYDLDEQQHLEQMLGLLTMSGDPFSRGHFEPGHFTASGFVLSPDGEQLLVIHHRKLDRWLQPGGHFEPGDDDLIAATRRELREEVGLEDLPLQVAGIFDLDVHQIPAHRDEPAHRHFDVRLLFRAPRLELRATSEVKAARFVPLTEIDAAQSDRSVMRAVDKLRRREPRA